MVIDSNGQCHMVEQWHNGVAEFMREIPLASRLFDLKSYVMSCAGTYPLTSPKRFPSPIASSPVKSFPQAVVSEASSLWSSWSQATTTVWWFLSSSLPCSSSWVPTVDVTHHPIRAKTFNQSVTSKIRGIDLTGSNCILMHGQMKCFKHVLHERLNPCALLLPFFHVKTIYLLITFTTCT